MERLLTSAFYLDLQEKIVNWLAANVMLPGNAVQLALVGFVFFCSHWSAGKIRLLIERIASRSAATPRLVRVCTVTSELAFPLAWLLVLWLARAIAAQAGWPYQVLQSFASLVTAWVVIRFASTFIRDPGWSKSIALIAWSMAALGTLGLFDATVTMLDSLALTIGTARISLLTIFKGFLSLGLLLWGASTVSTLLDQRIRRTHSFTPSMQVLLAKLVKILLIAMAILIALNTVGIDLTALAVFSGALGIGIGLGLQRIVSNLFSGLILLVDRSIKPGDVIAVGNTYGWISSLGARYTAVRTRDGTEHLIPNEDLIVQRVENWSHSDRVVRLRIPIGVAYTTDVRLAQQLCIEAAQVIPRILRSPPPACLLRGFGDSAVDLELRFWIDDPQNGRSNVMSEVLLGIWDRFHEQNIEIPFPQRDIHIRNGAAGLEAGNATKIATEPASK
ncbi:MAG TPA: mechanosensitive ion channel [Gammaproteobacteria bacterium]|nr:mechanosensitive ion channel [Gammaproteobacteria bacterium]